MSRGYNLGLPLLRQRTTYPGMMGVPGTDQETGIRTHCTGTVFYVDPNAAGVSDSRDGTDPEAPLATVAAALAKCQPHRGDVVLVMGNGAWQYNDQLGQSYYTPVRESVTVTVPGVSIIGVNPSSPVGVPWRPATDEGWCITVAAIDVLVQGFAFIGYLETTGANGILCDWDGMAVFGDNAYIRECYFDEDVEAAIQLEFSWNTIVEDCVFDGCDYGIYVDPAGSGAAYCDIRRNAFRSCTVGAIYGPGLDDCRIHDNIVQNDNAVAGGAATDEGIITTDGATDGSSNVVANNVITCLLPAAAPGDYDDLCSGVASDAWVNNHLIDGPNTDTPS